MAAAIAAPWLTPQAGPLPLLFPDGGRRWRRVRLAGERRPIGWARGGRRPAVVLLCEGDVSLFAAPLCLLAAGGASPQPVPLRLIPGITALAAAAAGGPIGPLALQCSRGCMVRPHAISPKALRALLDQLQEPPPEQRANLVLLKLGRRLVLVRAAAARRQAAGGSASWPSAWLAR